MRARNLLGGLFLAAGALLSDTMNAQLDRSRPPAPGPAPAVALGAHKTFQLPNGMRVIVVENHKLPMVSVQVRFDIRPAAQGAKAGYVDLVADLLAAGTISRSKASIDEEVDRIGASLSASSDGVYASALKKHLPALMDLVEDVVAHPAFPEDELQKARKRHQSEVEQRREDPNAIAETVGRAVTFGKGHPYGEVVTMRSLANADRPTLFAYHNRFFRPEAGYLVFVGDITLKEAKALAKAHFAKWRPEKPHSTVDEQGIEEVVGLGPLRFLAAPSTPHGARRVVLVDRPGAAQSIIRVCFPLNLKPNDLRAQKAQVMNTILGGGVFNARLMQNLREDKGWTYGVYSTLESDRFNGHFQVNASVRTAVTDSAIVETIKELERMRTALVTPEELDLAKRFMAGSFARSLEDPRTVAGFALRTYLNSLPADFYATYLKRLEAVTAEDVREAAELFLQPDHAVILVVGDRKELLTRLEPLSRATNPVVIELDYNAEAQVEELRQLRDRTAQDVVEAYLTAIGGRQAAMGLKDLRLDIELAMAGQAIGIKQWYGRDGRFRAVTKVGGAIVQEDILEDGRAVRKGPQGSTELFGQDLADLLFNGRAVPELWYGETAERVMLAGKTMLEGREVVKLFIVTNGGTTAGDYFDMESGLKVRRTEDRLIDGKPYTIVTRYADYRPVAGVLLPRTITQSGGPAGPITMTVTGAEANKGLDDALFKTNLPPLEEEPGSEGDH